MTENYFKTLSPPQKKITKYERWSQVLADLHDRFGMSFTSVEGPEIEKNLTTSHCVTRFSKISPHWNILKSLAFITGFCFQSLAKF